MTTTAYIAMGSNLGDRTAMLDGAVSMLRATQGVSVKAVSAYHETEPVGGPPGQGMYLNAAATLETTLDAVRLLGVLQVIEARFGRIRTERWGERTLDLDLLLFGDQIIHTSEVSIPHPLLATRRFVLEPLSEIAPQAVDPRNQHTISELLAALDQRRGAINP
jgi:2-amino-4-hydroxy-6-hydroxymethyldihydropteridine diphosphokinase